MYFHWVILRLTLAPRYILLALYTLALYTVHFLTVRVTATYIDTMHMHALLGLLHFGRMAVTYLSALI